MSNEDGHTVLGCQVCSTAICKKFVVNDLWRGVRQNEADVAQALWNHYYAEVSKVSDTRWIKSGWEPDSVGFHMWVLRTYFYDVVTGEKHTCTPKYLEYVAAYAAPGVGYHCKCTICGTDWAVVGGEMYKPEDQVHIMTIEDVR